MPAIQNQITWLYTRDLDGTCRFYAETLGLEHVHDEVHARVFRCGGGFIGICRVFKDRTVNPAGTMVSIVTDEVDRWHGHLSSRGVKVTDLDGVPHGRPREYPDFKIYAFLAEDPNGYRIEFQQFLDPAWTG